MPASTRWDIEVSQSTDDAVRQVLADDGEGGRGALSRFVEDAVRSRLLELEAERAKQQNSHLSPETIEDAVEQALEWARRR